MYSCLNAKTPRNAEGARTTQATSRRQTARMIPHSYLGGESYTFVTFQTDKWLSIKIPIRKAPYKVTFANARREIFAHDAGANIAPLLTKTTKLESIKRKQFNYHAKTTVTHIHGPSCIMGSCRKER